MFRKDSVGKLMKIYFLIFQKVREVLTGFIPGRPADGIYMLKAIY